MSTQKISYRASSTITISPENVATSSGFTSGVQSAAIDNTSNLDDDILIAGVWKAGTGLSLYSQVQVWVVPPRDDTPTWPDAFGASASARSVLAYNALSNYGRLGAVLNLDNTNGRVYDCGPFSVATLFGGVVPPKFVIFVTQNSGANSDATAGNHVWKATGISFTVA